MTLAQLDFIFPFVVFGYGLIMTVILSSDFFLNLAKENLPESLFTQWMSHKILGVVCLFVGGFWSLQNIWYQNI